MAKEVQIKVNPFDIKMFYFIYKTSQLNWFMYDWPRTNLPESLEELE